MKLIPCLCLARTEGVGDSGNEPPADPETRWEGGTVLEVAPTTTPLVLVMPPKRRRCEKAA